MHNFIIYAKYENAKYEMRTIIYLVRVKWKIHKPHKCVKLYLHFMTLYASYQIRAGWQIGNQNIVIVCFLSQVLNRGPLKV